MKIGIVGGGINGLCAAWQLGLAGYEVTLFERDRLLAHTSSASSKLLHGGLRYLEQFQFRLVAEALRERQWWLRHVPEHAREIRLLYPIYKHGRRPGWMVRAGLAMYQALAGSRRLGPVVYWSAASLVREFPSLRAKGLQGAYEFSDGQMNEASLGNWVAEQAKSVGCVLREQTEVCRVDTSGMVYLQNECIAFDCVVNMAGPWADTLARKSDIPLRHTLDLVRGSHLILDRPCKTGWMLEVPGEERIFFVLPWQGKILLGTTEVRQTLDEAIACSDEERDYLLKAYNYYFSPPVGSSDIIGSFAGLRPLIRSAANPSHASREYVIEHHGRVVTVLGGKWTTARALGKRLVKEVGHAIH